MISKTMRVPLCARPETGPTIEALNHGAVEIRPLHRSNKRGPMVARRVGIHERLYARGRISDAQWNWVCRYVTESEIAAGARPGKPEVEPVDVWNGPLIYNRQCAAAGFLRRAHERITYQERLVLIAACVECVTIAALGPMLGLERGVNEDTEVFRKRIDGVVRMACARIISLASGIANQPAG